jgi:hypothetical protein
LTIRTLRKKYDLDVENFLDVEISRTERYMDFAASDCFLLW